MNLTASNFPKVSIILFLIILFFGCGRKQKNIFHFPSDKPTLQVNKLYFPAVQGLKVIRTMQGNVLSWQPVKNLKEIQIDAKEKVTVEFMGYNVYRLVNGFFVCKKSVNEFLIKDLQFLDSKVLEKNLIGQHHSYIVRAVFKVNDKIIQGPSSQVVLEIN